MAVHKDDDELSNRDPDSDQEGPEPGAGWFDESEEDTEEEQQRGWDLHLIAVVNADLPADDRLHETRKIMHKDLHRH